MKHLYLIFIATFVLGFLSGVLVYIQSHTGKEGDGALESTPKGFVVTATRYGNSDEIVSSSYRIINNGSYTVIDRSKDGTEKKHEGTLKREEEATLNNLLAQTDYEALLNTSFSEVCPITTGGYAYRYGISYDNTEYNFDSCKQDLRGSELFGFLNQLFATTAIPNSNE